MNIQQGIVAINGRADVIIGAVNGIKADTGTINALAGGILGQAQGICGDAPALIGIALLGHVC